MSLVYVLNLSNTANIVVSSNGSNTVLGPDAHENFAVAANVDVVISAG